MSRALQVVVGVSLILALWSWMILSIDTNQRGWTLAFIIVGKLLCACFITGPVYREYLR